MTTPSDDEIIGLLHGAFVDDGTSTAAGETLLGSVQLIESHVIDGVLFLGGGNGNGFHAVPLDLDMLREGIAALANRT